MTEVQAPLVDVSQAETAEHSADKDALIVRLDELLEQYLNKLDEYQKAREQLSKNLSSGFFSLAQANFQNRSNAVHYGQDCYDERMQAIRKVTITDKSTENKEEVAQFKINLEQPQPTEPGDEKDSEKDSKSPHTANPPEENDTPENDKEKPDTDKPSTTTPKSNDPLRWFGILVPPILRTAQSTFVSTVEGPIPQIATIARELRRQEMEIGRVRKQIRKMEGK